jgi:protocatechuate 3,4-dioxygenase beta subunit
MKLNLSRVVASLPSLCLGASFLVLAPASPASARVRIVGLPCEGCEAVFEGLPERPPARARLGAAGEAGEPMVIEGTVKRADGSPAADIIVYAYQTDASGVYPRATGLQGAAARHGRLRGWARTDAAGRYRFDTIRPAGYPGTRIPSHVHMHVIEPRRCTYYIDDILFTDDERLTPQERSQASPGRGGPGIVTPRREGAGGWHVTRDIELGKNIPGYEQCGS